MRFSLLLSLAVAALLAGPADAQRRATGTISTTPLQSPVLQDVHHSGQDVRGTSGTSSSSFETFDLVVPDGGWVYGIEIGELSDEPCHLNLLWATIDNGEFAFSERPFSQCYSAEPTRHSLTRVGMAAYDTHSEWVLSWPELGVVGPIGAMIVGTIGAFDNSAPRFPSFATSDGDPYALKGIGICQRDGNDKMKGISVRGVTLRRGSNRMNTRPVQDADDAWIEDTFQRPNCNDWQPTRSCANGEVVVGTRLFYEYTNGARKKAQIKGLAPICTRLTTES